jgi:WD40 repeat protein/energy-coupling factor transporter ATP-binding protein EcfA2
MFGDDLATYFSVSERQERLIPLKLKVCDLPLHLNYRVCLDCTHAESWEAELARLRHVLSAPEPLSANIPCPYPGMVPFDRDSAAFFYGRESEIDDLVRRLREQRFLFIIGASGVGKSSLVLAGLMPRLESSELFADNRWLLRSMTPGPDPSTRLVAALDGDISELLTANPRPRRLLLFIDQFEELFTQTPSAEQLNFCKRFADLRNRDDVTILVCMRANFYPDLLNSPVWPVPFQERIELVPPRGQALCDAIRKPAEQVNVYVERELLDQLLHDAANEPGALPLMQEAMVLLWDKRRRHLLTLDAYRRLGRGDSTGLASAMAGRADASMNILDANRQAIARRIFLRLIQFGEGRPHTRRQQPRAALRSVTEKQSDFETTLDHLTNRRLLTATGEYGSDDQKFDLAHETLITGWPMLKQWVDERRDAEQTRRRLEYKATEWLRLGSADAGLLDEVELAEAERWLAGPDAKELGYTHILFGVIGASRVEIDRWRATEEATRQHELRQTQALLLEQEQRAEAEKQRAEEQRLRVDVEKRRAEEQERRTRTFRRLALALGLVLVIAILAGLTALRNQRVARSHELMAYSVSSTRDDPERGLLLALSAVTTTWKANHDTVPEALGTLHQALVNSRIRRTLRIKGHSVRSVTWSPDGKRLAIGDDTGGISFWDVAAGQTLTELVASMPNREERASSFEPSGVTAMAWSSKLRYFAANDALGTVRVWKGPTYRSSIELKAHCDELTPEGYCGGSWSSEPVTSLAWNSDEDLLAVGTWDKNGITIFKIKSSSDGFAGQDPNGQQVLTLPCGIEKGFTLRVWNADLGRDEKAEHSGGCGVLALAWQPGGGLLAAGLSNHTVQLWNTRGEKRTLTGHADAVTGVAWSPDGSRLATTSTDNTARVWEASTGRPMLTLLGHHDHLTGITWSPSGRFLATSGQDRSVRVWDADTGEQIFTLMGHTAPVTSVAWRPDADEIATGGSDGTTRIWYAGAAEELLTFQAHKDGIKNLGWSPDGKRIATASRDRLAKVWDVATGRLLFTLSGHTNQVGCVGWSPNGAYLATGSWDGSVKIWDPNSGQLLRTLSSGHEESVMSLAWSPDSQRLAVGLGTMGESGNARVWDTEGKELLTLRGHFVGQVANVLGIAWSPDGKRLVTAGSRNMAIIWDAVDGKNHGIAAGHGRDGYAFRGFEVGNIFSVAWSPDGTKIATASDDFTAKIWDADTAREILTLRGHQSRVMSVSWRPDGTQLVTGSADGTAKVWDAATGRELLTLPGANDELTSVSWNPTGTVIATSSWDNSVRLYRTDTDALIQLAKQRVTRSLTLEECSTFLHVSPCPPDF